VSPRVYAALTFSLLTILAALLVANAVGGVPVPRSVIAALIFAQGLVRFFHFSTQPEKRRSGVVQLLIAALVAYLIVASA
jgi:heme/copper-type cytochrome/quinol oxidase subunit 4